MLLQENLIYTLIKDILDFQQLLNIGRKVLNIKEIKLKLKNQCSKIQMKLSTFIQLVFFVEKVQNSKLLMHQILVKSMRQLFKNYLI
jgi:hypothetical protein